MFLRDLCLRTFGAACDRCVRCCPYEAIEFDEEGAARIDHDACTRCGLCLGVCDAFASTRVTTADLHGRMQRAALRGERPIVACTRCFEPGFEPATCVVDVPCLAAVPPELWARAQAEELNVRLYADFGKCEDCVRAGNLGAMLWEHAVQTAEQWTDRSLPFVETLPEKDSFVRDMANPGEVDRRSLLGNLAIDAADIASGRRRTRNSDVLQQFYEQRERARAHAHLKLSDAPALNRFAPLGTVRKVMFPKRKLLLEAIDADESIAPRVPLALSHTDAARCENTLSCAKACPTNARFPHPETGSLAFDARYCIGCGLCVDACPHGAAEVRETTAIDLLDAIRKEQTR